MPTPSSVTIGASEKKSRVKTVRGAEDGVNREDAAMVQQHSEQPRKARMQYVKKVRNSKKKNTREEMEAVREHVLAQGVQNVLPFLGVQQYVSFEAAEEALIDYCASHNCSMRSRDSTSPVARNNALVKQHNGAVERATKKGVPCTHELHLVPEELTYYMRLYECVHAEHQPDRVQPEDRLRHQKTTAYRACPARVRFLAERVKLNDKFVWRVVVDQENTIHNHECSERLFNTYDRRSIISDPVLLATTAAQIEADGNPRIIRDQISNRLGRHFSRSQFSNLKHFRLGGGEANANLEKLLEAFTEQEGNRCVVLHDQEDMILGLIFQTAAQRILFEKYGDSLILDWTHNSNNLNFYAGCLMATSATGKGIPVLDFLCLSQGVQMMETVLSVFVEENESAMEIVESFVIDKDYKEWKAISTVFTNVKVVLCQFHVVKWFKTVVSNSKYAIPSDKRRAVLQLVRSMMYAESAAEFARFKSLLFTLLPIDKHAQFHEYLVKRWLDCKEMWANHVRGKVFTSGNTTSNRLESHWHQFKAALGKKRRIDRCVEAIFLRQTAIFRDEIDDINDSTSSTRLLRNDHRFIRGLFMNLSESREKLVRKQWNKYLARSTEYHAPSSDRSHGETGVYPSASSTTRFEVRTPDDKPWTCSCRFASSHRLPCRHQFFVGYRLQHHDAFPTHALAPRWKMSVAATLIPSLEEAVNSLSRVRLPIVVNSESTHSKQPGKPAEVPLTRLGRRKRVTFRRLKRREVDKVVVLEAYEKRNIARAQCERLVHKMMALGTAAFWDASASLENAITDFMSQLTSLPNRDHRGVCARPDSEQSSTSTTAAHGLQSDASRSGCKNPGEEESTREYVPDAGGDDADSKGEAADVSSVPGNGPGEEESTREDVPDAGVDDENSKRKNADGFSVPGDLREHHVAEHANESDDDGEDFSENGYADAVLFNDSDEEADDEEEDEERARAEIIGLYDGDDLFAEFFDGGDCQMDPGLAGALTRCLQDTSPAWTPLAYPYDSSIANPITAPSHAVSCGSPPPSTQPRQGAEHCIATSRTALVTRSQQSVTPCSESVDFIDNPRTVKPVRFMRDLLNSESPPPQPVPVDEDSPSEPVADVADENRSSTRKRRIMDNAVELSIVPRAKKRGRLFGYQMAQPTKGRTRNSKQQTSTKYRTQVGRADGKSSSTECSSTVKRSESRATDANICVNKLVQFARHGPLGKVLALASTVQKDPRSGGFENRSIVVHKAEDEVPTATALFTQTDCEAVVAAIAAKTAEDDGYNAKGDGCEYVATVSGRGESLVVSGRSVTAMLEFYTEKSRLKSVQKDRDWLRDQRIWDEVVDIEIPFLEWYLIECAGASEEALSPLDRMRSLIIERLDELSLYTIIATAPSVEQGIVLWELAGRLSYSAWLNDSCVFMSLSLLASRFPDVAVVDPLCAGKMSIPTTRLMWHRLLVFPINTANAHWCCIIVEFDVPTRRPSSVYYDPFGTSFQSSRHASKLWETWVCPLLDAWAKRDILDGFVDTVDASWHRHGFGTMAMAQVSAPAQPTEDGWNCGLFCIIQAWCFMTKDFSLHSMATISQSQMTIIRLRVMYMIFVKAPTRTDTEESSEAECTIAALARNTGA